MKLFSDKNRPAHLGPYPLERLKRGAMPDLGQVNSSQRLSFHRETDPVSIVNAMGEYQAMLDAIRIGIIAKVQSEIPANRNERSNHLKSFGYFSDASMVGVCALPDIARLETPMRNPGIDHLAADLKTRQVKTLASGVDVIMADLKETMMAPASSIDAHKFGIVFAYDMPRDPEHDEQGADWIQDAQAHRAALRANETACVIANYLRILGFDARAHSASCADVDLNKMAVAAGIATMDGQGQVIVPYLGQKFGLAAVTTELELAPDAPLAPLDEQNTQSWAWRLGIGSQKNGRNFTAFSKRKFKDGDHPFETLKRVDEPTTFIDEPRIPRVPKRTDMFARALLGDMGKKVQDGARNGHYARKAAPSAAQRRALGAFIPLQDGDHAPTINKTTQSANKNADNIKAACYFLGVDAVGLSRCPDWVWYSHDARGNEIVPPHDQAINMVIDQGYETMEGASGDDWIACAQSMRAYLRFSLLGGVIAQHIRNLGYPAKAHTVMDGEVLQPPLLLLSGLGEVSRIGEVILNPFLGPRLKSGVVTTTMPMTHDKPIDFGLQTFCESCNKCARECPSGAITAGPKLMFNGYETWKSDSQKCTTYRITNMAGAMCGRCMKTCPWNLEGIFKERPFRWLAMNMPKAAPLLARLDDAVDNGTMNSTKKWWWDLEWCDDGAYRPTTNGVNERDLQKDLDLKFEDQTLAVYPANLAPIHLPYPDPMNREQGIAAYNAMITAEHYKIKLANGETDLAPQYRVSSDLPVIEVVVSHVEETAQDVVKYEFSSIDGTALPEWTAGAHIDIVVAPEFLRQYSLSGNPAQRDKYQIAVLREDMGKGGSVLMQRIFTVGRRVFISKPINHFPLIETAKKTFLMGGGIGVTPMIAMAHRAHTLGLDFELHYCATSRKTAGFLNDLPTFPWADRVHYHFSDENTRADLDAVLSGYQDGWQVYTCGPDRFMDGVMTSAINQGFTDDARHLEYFALPETPEYVNHDFTLRLAKSNREIHVRADQTATDALIEAGVHIDVKCSDGICGVCKCGLLSGEVEHRDFVLSNKQREDAVILCQSRAAKHNATIEVDL
ncbi:hypothetical protein GCM10008927_27860 [Amylibacter ulvae]|uniref:NAD-binding oxidoreductase n=1 Tax=Paramylibacter ulvae TaxID=1651968 RepID=A0ABQ3D7W9_9RHOB|nr:reductive dehalogenase domain-containing protein [Amylibacter ulvae]GHA60747.1 hypothetical protein GCM10008927_27860 [Amylibacter ulvae]